MNVKCSLGSRLGANFLFLGGRHRTIDGISGFEQGAGSLQPEGLDTAHVRGKRSPRAGVNRADSRQIRFRAFQSYCGHDDVVEFLLENSVSLAEKNDKGRTAVMLAAMCGNEGVAEVLLTRGGGLFDWLISAAAEQNTILTLT